MNLLANKKTHYYFFLVFLFFLNSCKSKKNLGNEIVPSNEQIKVLVDSSFLELSTLRFDSIPTYLYRAVNSNTFVFGQTTYNNSISTNIITYAQVNYPVSIPIDPDATLDSLVLSIEGNGIGLIQGDTNQDFTLSVFKTSIPVDTSFKYGFQKIALENDPLGQKSFRPTDAQKYKDTIAIILDQNYAQELFDNIKANGTTASFLSVSKGLAFVGTGGSSISVDLTNGNNTNKYIKLKLHYTTSANLRSFVDLSPVVKANNLDYLTRYFVGFQNQYNGNLAQLKHKDTLKSSNNNGHVVLQRNSSLSAKLKIPSLSYLTNNKESVMINRAELILKGSNNPNIFQASYLDSLLYVGYSSVSNNLNYTNYVYNYYLQTQPLIVRSAYLNNENTFRIDITDYINDLVTGKTTNRDLVIYNANYGVLTLGDGTINPKNYLLKVYYTKLN